MDKMEIAFVHDKDSKSRKLISEMGWQIDEIVDCNHAIKSFRSKFQRMKNNTTNKLRGLKAFLERFFQSLLRIDLPINTKKDLWMNVPENLSGNHYKYMQHKECEPWKFIKIGNNRQVIDNFLEKTKPLLAKCDRIHSTQMCESLHAAKSHYANKNITWKSSWMPQVVVDENSDSISLRGKDRSLRSLSSFSPFHHKWHLDTSTK